MSKFVSHVEARLNATCDAVAAAREAHRAAPTAETRAALDAAKDAQGHAHDIAMAAVEASLGPVQMWEVVERGVVYVVTMQTTTLGGGGGRTGRVGPGDARYASLRAQIAANRATDQRVLAAALEAWGTDQVSRVKIDYYGDRAMVYEVNKFGRPKHGGRRHTMLV
jgi:hypothetical protein